MAIFVIIRVYKEPVISPNESDRADRQAGLKGVSQELRLIMAQLRLPRNRVCK